jgi:hypothetical protein
VTYAQRTEVGSDKSRSEIERTLIRYGASEFAYGWKSGEAVLGFAIANRRISFRLPLPDRRDARFTHTPARGTKRSPEAEEREYEQAVRQRWRALALVIKAKLEAVEAGISTIETEFLAHIMLPDGSTVGETVAPRIALAYDRGEVPALLPGPGDQ